MKSYPQMELIRMTCNGDKILIDDGYRREGRGIYICRDKACIDRVRSKKIFSRILRRKLNDGATEDVYCKLLIMVQEEINGSKGK